MAHHFSILIKILNIFNMDYSMHHLYSENISSSQKNSSNSLSRRKLHNLSSRGRNSDHGDPGIRQSPQYKSGLPRPHWLAMTR